MFCGITIDLARKIFPDTPVANLEKYLPDVAVAALSSSADRMMFMVALATIRAEVENFIPCSEGISRFNTSLDGNPFDLYDHRKELGNQGPPDGERYRGRGYVQLTGRDNYSRIGAALSLPLLQSPDMATESIPAAKILFQFLKNKREQLGLFVAADNLAAARRVVNGGFHGLSRFREAFTLADFLLPQQ